MEGYGDIEIKFKYIVYMLFKVFYNIGGGHRKGTNHFNL